MHAAMLAVAVAVVVSYLIERIISINTELIWSLLAKNFARK